MTYIKQRMWLIFSEKNTIFPVIFPMQYIYLMDFKTVCHSDSLTFVFTNPNTHVAVHVALKILCPKCLFSIFNKYQTKTLTANETQNSFTPC